MHDFVLYTPAAKTTRQSLRCLPPAGHMFGQHRAGRTRKPPGHAIRTYACGQRRRARAGRAAWPRAQVSTRCARPARPGNVRVRIACVKARIRALRDALPGANTDVAFIHAANQHMSAHGRRTQRRSILLLLMQCELS
jgi:hypothetical protein